MGEFHVSGIAFSAEGVEFTFMELPGDVRQEGGIIRTRSYAARWDNPSYADELEELRELARTLVVDIDEDWPAAPVFVPGDLAHDGDEMGGGEES